MALSVPKIVPSSLPAPLKVEYRTVTVDEQNAKQMVLSSEIQNPDSFMFDICGSGGPQFLHTDYVLNGNVVTWEGLALDGLLAEGDRVRFAYQ